MRKRITSTSAGKMIETLAHNEDTRTRPQGSSTSMGLKAMRVPPQ